MKKLKKILLINWLYFSKQLIEVGDINFITGKNGSGKSTIIDALQIVLLGETNARNFNQAASDKSQRTLNGYLRADMDENFAGNRKGKDFTSLIACEFVDDLQGTQFTAGAAFDCRSDGTNVDHFFLYPGGIPQDCFVVHGVALSYTDFRKRLREEYGVKAELYDTQKQYRTSLLAKWNVHTPQVMRMMKRAVSFKPITDIQSFITENICDVQERPDIEAMQQNIRDYQRHEQLAQRQEEKLEALKEISADFREMQQAIERYRQQSFLVSWAKKEDLEGRIHKLRLDEKSYEEEILQAEQAYEHLSEEIEEKERRKNELTVACAQSEVFREEERLHTSKSTLENEQKRLVEALHRDSLEIKREALKVDALCDKVLAMEPKVEMEALAGAALETQEAYAPFASCDETVFSGSLQLFEKAQESTERFLEAARTAAYQAEVQLEAYRHQLDEKKALLVGLQHAKKPYPKGLHQLQKELRMGLEQQYGNQVRVDILADVLEIPEKEDRWRGAVEGYLNTQKFYLLVEPACYQDALRLFDELKQQYHERSFGLVDIGKLREREEINPRTDSLAQKIETENELARSYIDYLLGRVICCDRVEELRNYRRSITAEGMVYQGYVARPLRKQWMEDAFIGQRAIEIQMQRLQQEIREIEAQIMCLQPVCQTLSSKKMNEPLLSRYFIQSTVVQRQGDYLRNLEICKELDKIEEDLSHLDIFWLDEQRNRILTIETEITEMRRQGENQKEKQGNLREKVRQLEEEILPDLYQKLAHEEDCLQDEFSPEFIEKIGRPRYEQELTRLQKASAVCKNFSNRLVQTENERETAQKKLWQTRREYVTTFRPCSFQVEVMDNEEYAAEQARLEESELPKYRSKIKAARESAMEQFQNDFLAKLKSSIDQVQDQVKSLNKALKQAQFGTDQYLFRVDRNPDYADYYDMIMAPELMEGDAGLFALPFQQKYGPLIEELFRRLSTSDDTQINAKKQSELQENIQRYTDFRTYLKFDLETTDQNGAKQLLSQTLNKKSGGEVQTPFYIAVLASFAQLYQVNNLSTQANNTVRLVVFDEAFNKMDSERIVESVRLLRKMGLQAIICTPPDKIADIMPYADETFWVNKSRYQMRLLPYGKEISKV